MRRLLGLLVLVVALACSRNVLEHALDTLDTLCETRPALAKIHACEADVGCKIDVTKAFLVEHGPDDEVSAALAVLEDQVRKLQQQ